MNIEIKGVHYDVSKNTKEHMEKKLKKLEYTKDIIIDLLFTITRVKNGYTVESNINFRWGVRVHLKVESFELFEGIDKLFEKIEHKVTKEKEKVQHHNKRQHI